MMVKVEGLDFEHKYITYKEYEDDYYVCYAGFDEIELMQYTGLKDKNGVEIFEGDIVRFEIGDELFESAYIIAYDQKDCSFSLFSIKKRKPYMGLLWHLLNDIKVIGNIYENPELLEDL